MRWHEIISYILVEDISTQIDRLNKSLGNKVLSIYQNEFPNETDSRKVIEWILNYDPTPNKQYRNWLVNIYIKEKIKSEDMYKLSDDLKLFDEVKRLLPIKDINQYKTSTDLYQAIQEYENQDNKSNNQLKRDEKDKIWQEIETIYDTPSYGIYVPKTKEASCFLGKGTKWCTAATESNNLFNRYNKRGPLYVIFIKNEYTIVNVTDRTTGEKTQVKNVVKYQFQLASDQFMDVLDQEINLVEFWEKYPELHKVFDKIAKKDGGKGAGNIRCYIDPSYDDYLQHASHDGLTLLYVPEKYKDYNMCMTAVSNDGTAVEHIDDFIKSSPIEKQYELIKAAVSNNGTILLFSEDFIKSLPIEKQYELIKAAVSNNPITSLEYGKELIKTLPVDKQYELYKDAITKSKLVMRRNLLNDIPNNPPEYLRDRIKQELGL